MSLCHSLSLSLDLLLVVETSPESLTTSHNIQFSVNCTATAEVDGEPLTVTIEWRRVTPSGTSELVPALYTTAGSPERGYQSVLTTSENDSTVNTTIYRCTASTYNYSSYSDITVHVEGRETSGLIGSQKMCKGVGSREITGFNFPYSQQLTSALSSLSLKVLFLPLSLLLLTLSPPIPVVRRFVS